MTGETDLNRLLHSMSPTLLTDDFVFISSKNAKTLLQQGLEPKCLFEEAEGTTLVITRKAAIAFNLPTGAIYHCISLNVHSSLEAVGLTAAVSAALAKAQISANVIAAYYHDHIFVPASKSAMALDVLKYQILPTA